MNNRMLGDTIKRLRTQNRLSQSKLAELIGVSIVCVRKWEAYKECPQITLVPLLAGLLDVTTDSDLFLHYYDFVIGEEN